MMIRGENILTLAREVVEAEDALNEKLARFSAAVNTNGVAAPKHAGKAAIAAELDAPALPFGTRLRNFFESRPNVRMHLEQIRAQFPEAKPLTMRKALFRLTHEVKGFKRDKRARGVYYYSE